MEPDVFEESLWLSKERMLLVSPQKVSTRRSAGPKGELVERVCDAVAASKKLARQDQAFWRWRRHLRRDRFAITFQVELGKMQREVRKLKVPKTLPVLSRGKLLCRCQAIEREDGAGTGGGSCRGAFHDSFTERR